MFHDPVGRDFKQRISQREQRDRDGVVGRRHSGLLEQVVTGFGIEDFGIANVASVQEIEQVHPAAEGQDADVQPSIQQFVPPLVEFNVIATLGRLYSLGGL